MKINEKPGKFITRAEVRLIRLLPGPIERVWEFLTDPVKRARWFAGGVCEPKVGGKNDLLFQHKYLSPNEAPPEQYKQMNNEGFTMPSIILRCEPPRVLSYTFDDASEVTFELTVQGNDVLLLLTHRARGEDIPSLAGYASGWHTHFALLIAILEGSPPPPFWATHQRLKVHYAEAYAALPQP